MTAPFEVLAGLERQVSHLRGAVDADATPEDVLSVVDFALTMQPALATVADAMERALNWSGRQGGHGLPTAVERQLEAALKLMGRA